MSISAAAVGSLFPGSLMQASRSTIASAKWSTPGGRGAGEVLDATPGALVLSGTVGLHRGERVHLQIEWSGRVFHIAGTIMSSSKVLGGQRIDLDRPNYQLFTALWGNLAREAA